ncbi:MAG: S41 family peptidase [Geovibrio sp.]|nr:S41 family peptidase [Geovibrio sp.]
MAIANVQAQKNPVLPGLYADPEVLYSEQTGRYYIYPTTDGQRNWTGHDFHVFEIRDMKHWEEKGVVLDLRNNPGGLLTEAINVSSIFLPSGKEVVYTKDRTGRDQHFKSSAFTLREEKTPLVLLVNEGSASASEILAGAIQDYKRGVLVGKKTYGKASVQSIIPLRDGSAVKLTTAKYYTPKGRMIHDKGIEPDLSVEDVSDNVTLTQEEIDKLAADISKPVIDLQRDEQLKAAVEKLREMIKNG